MNISGQAQPDFVLSKLANFSLACGAVAQLFPAISIAFLIVRNGGSGYVQSLICGAPIAVIGALAGVAVLLHGRTQGRRADWRAVTGIVLGLFFFLMALILTYVLLAPYLTTGEG